MKKILFTALLVAALLTQMVTFSFAASEFDTNVSIDETYEGSANAGKEITAFGWTRSNTSYGKLKVVSVDGNNVMEYTPANNWDNNKFTKSIDDLGEGTYELSYRMNFGKKKIALHEVFSIKGYTLNSDETKTTVEISKCSTYGANFFVDFGSNQSYFPKADIPDDTWIDCKLKIDTVNNKCDFIMGYADESGKRVLLKKYSAGIPSIDGLLNLTIYLGNNADSYDDTNKVALDKLLLDDLKLVKTDILNDSFDFADAGTLLASASSWVKSDDGYCNTPKLALDESKLGNVVSFKPSTTPPYDVPVAITNNLAETGEGVYEITYRVNFGNDNTYAVSLFDVSGYYYENGAKVNKKLFGISGYNGTYTLHRYNESGASVRTYTCWTKADSDKWHNEWLDVRYVVDTINNLARVEFGYIDANGNYKTNADVANWSIIKVEGLSKLYTRAITKKETGDGDLRFDDFKVRMLKSWYDASTGKPVDNLSEIQPNGEGKKVATYVSHYYSTSANAKPTDVYLALYNGDKLAAGVKAETLNVPGYASNKVYKLNFELPEDLTGLTGNIFKWQPDLTPITNPIAVPVN